MTTTANLRHVAIGGAMWSAGQRWVGRVTQFGTFLALARVLRPQDFGLVALAAFFVGLSSVLVDMGMTSYIVQRDELGPSTLETAFWLSVLLGSVLAAATMLGAPLIAGLYHQSQLTPILRVLGTTFVLAALSSTQAAILQRQLQFRALAMRSFLATLVAAGVALVLAYSGAGAWSLVVQSLTTALVGVLVLWRVSEWRPRFAFSTGECREMLTYGMSVLGMEMMGYLRARGGDLIVGSVLGTSSLGVFTVANRLLSSILDTFSSVILTVAGPIFARVKRDRDQLTRAYKHALTYSVAMTAPVLIVLAINSPRLVPEVFGSQWGESGALARVLCIGAITGALTYFDRSLLLMLNKAKAELGVTAAAMASHLLVLAATAPFGLHFLVASLAVRNLLFWPFRLLVARRYGGIPVRPVLEPVLRVLAAALLAATVPVGVYLAIGELPTVAVTAICAVAMVPAYVLALRLVSRQSYDEFRLTTAFALGRLRGRRVPAQVSVQA